MPTAIPLGPIDGVDCEATLGDRFHAVAAAGPESLAIDDDGRSTTYRGLQQAVARLAIGIGRRLGAAEEPIAVLTARGPAFIEAALAVLQAGKIVVPLDAAHPDERIRMILADCRPRLIVTEPSLIDRAATRKEPGLDVMTLDEAEAEAARAPVLSGRWGRAGGPSSFTRPARPGGLRGCSTATGTSCSTS